MKDFDSITFQLSMNNNNNNNSNNNNNANTIKMINRNDMNNYFITLTLNNHTKNSNSN